MSETRHSLVSIIVPVFNREALIIDTLQSIKKQSYSNLECLIIDDGSTDSTLDTVNTFIILDKRFKILNNTREKGAQGARNTGLLNSRGIYVSFFDSDDLMHPEKILKQVQYLDENPDCDICTCFSHLMNDDDEIIGAFKWNHSGNILSSLLLGTTYVDQNSPLMRKTALERIGVLDEKCPSFQEWDTHIRLASFSKYATIPEFFVSCYQSKSERISNDRRREIAGLFFIYQKHKELWLKIAGENIYSERLYRLYLKIPKTDKQSIEKFNEEFRNFLIIPIFIKARIRLNEYFGGIRKSIRNILFPVIKIIKYRYNLI